jgi:hypothetical protein
MNPEMGREQRGDGDVATLLCLLNKMFFRNSFPGKIVPVENMVIALSLLSAQNAERSRMGYINMEFIRPEGLYSPSAFQATVFDITNKLQLCKI